MCMLQPMSSNSYGIYTFKGLNNSHLKDKHNLQIVYHDVKWFTCDWNMKNFIFGRNAEEFDKKSQTKLGCTKPVELTFYRSVAIDI